MSGWGLEKTLRKRKVAAFLDQAEEAFHPVAFEANDGGTDLYSAENVIRYMKRRKIFRAQPEAQGSDQTLLSRRYARPRSIDATFAQITCHERLFKSMSEWTTTLSMSPSRSSLTSLRHVVTYCHLYVALEKFHDSVDMFTRLERSEYRLQALSQALFKWQLSTVWMKFSIWPLWIPFMIYTVMKLRKHAHESVLSKFFVEIFHRGTLLRPQEKASFDLLCNCLQSLSFRQMNEWTTRVRDTIGGYQILRERPLVQEPLNTNLVVQKFIWAACDSIIAAEDDDLLATLVRLKELALRMRG